MSSRYDEAGLTLKVIILDSTMLTELPANKVCGKCGFFEYFD
jgi:hypothetical protein